MVNVFEAKAVLKDTKACGDEIEAYIADRLRNQVSKLPSAIRNDPQLAEASVDGLIVGTQYIFYINIENIPLYQGLRFHTVDSKVESTSFILCEDKDKALKSHEWLTSSSGVMVPQCFGMFCHKNKWLVAIEPVENLTSYFERMMEGWSCTGKLADEKVSWFNHIDPKFKIIFKDSISALCTVTYAKKFKERGTIYFNNLENSLLISKADESVKLLPEFDAKNGGGINIDKMHQLISKIIGLPFHLTDVAKDVDFKLPPELVTFLHNLSNDNLKSVGLIFLLDTPYFWSGEQKYRFIENVYGLIKRKVIQKETLDAILQYSHNKAKWTENIAKYPVLRAIYHYFGSSGVAPAKYELNVDVVRFSSNVYRHYNDEQYKSLRSKALKRVEIERVLSAAIPSLYVDLYEGLLLYAKSYRRKRESIFETSLCSEDL